MVTPASGCAAEVEQQADAVLQVAELRRSPVLQRRPGRRGVTVVGQGTFGVLGLAVAERVEHRGRDDRAGPRRPGPGAPEALADAPAGTGRGALHRSTESVTASSVEPTHRPGRSRRQRDNGTPMTTAGAAARAVDVSSRSAGRRRRRRRPPRSSKPAVRPPPRARPRRARRGRTGVGAGARRDAAARRWCPHPGRRESGRRPGAPDARPGPAARLRVQPHGPGPSTVGHAGSPPARRRVRWRSRSRRSHPLSVSAGAARCGAGPREPPGPGAGTLGQQRGHRRDAGQPLARLGGAGPAHERDEVGGAGRAARAPRAGARPVRQASSSAPRAAMSPSRCPSPRARRAVRPGRSGGARRSRA